METTTTNNTLPAAWQNGSSVGNSLCGIVVDSDAERAFKSIALSALLLASLVGNCLVVVIIYRIKSMRTTVNYFIVNMAISDLIIPLVVLPRQILEISTGLQHWRVGGAFGVITCKFVFFISDITPSVSVLSMVFMTLDRFCAVAFPFKANSIPSLVRPLLIMITWLASMAFFAPYFYYFDLDSIGGQMYCRLTWDITKHKAFTITACIVFIIIPFALLAGLYTGILVILRRNRGTGEEIECQRKRRERVNTAIIKLALTIVLIFAICWGPYNGVMFLLTFVWDWEIPPGLCSWPTLWFIVSSLAYLPPAVNPMIYFVLNEKYRTGFKRAFATRSCGYESTALHMLSTSRTRNQRKPQFSQRHQNTKAF